MRTFYPSKNKTYKKLSDQIVPLLQANELALVYSRNQTSMFIRTSQNAVEILSPHFESCIDLKEICLCATLSKRNEVLGIYQVSSGSNSGTIVDITKITAKAILTNASAVILAHNHPSGNPKPSPQDIDITKKLKSALDLFDIRLLDHIILYQEDSVKYTSMAEEGYM